MEHRSSLVLYATISSSKSEITTVIVFEILKFQGTVNCQPDLPLSVYLCRSLHLLVFWILFENVMSLRRTKAAIIGLLEANCVNEWVVTEKLGNTLRQKNTFKASKKVRSCIRNR
ncbi:hypothetical protein Peur_044973 [Populus x canadensis]